MKILSIGLLAAAFGFVGCSDYEDALKQETHYCAMVKTGSWPAYNESINCEERNSNEKN